MKFLFHGTLFPGTGGFFVQVAQKPEISPGVFVKSDETKKVLNLCLTFGRRSDIMVLRSRERPKPLKQNESRLSQ